MYPRATAAQNARGTELIVKLRGLTAMLQQLLSVSSSASTPVQGILRAKSVTKGDMVTLASLFAGVDRVSEAWRRLRLTGPDMELIETFSRYPRMETGWEGPVLILGAEDEVFVSPPLAESRECEPAGSVPAAHAENK